MWNVKSTTLFAVSLVAVILISISMAKADEKTITPKEFATAIAETPKKVGNHLKNEWEETKEFQKAGWAEMKTKWPWNKIFKSEAQ